MKYDIQGGASPVLICNLQDEESVLTRGQNMSWMSPNIKVEAHSGKTLSRSFFSEKSIMNTRYTAIGGFGTIAFASTLPGEIIALKLDGTKDYLCQRTSILASTFDVVVSKYLNEKINTTLFGEDGFTIERVSGQGVIFLETDGSVINYPLQAGQQIIVETGRVVMTSGSCDIELRKQKDLNNPDKIVYNTIVTGPGIVLLQTMSPSKIAHEMQKRMK